MCARSRMHRDPRHHRAQLDSDLRAESGVPMREFIDAAGVRWTVWSTTPFSSGVASNLRTGWLTFESSGTRRRLAPIPEGWEEAAVDRLRSYCAAAEAVGRTPITGSRPIEPRD